MTFDRLRSLFRPGEEVSVGDTAADQSQVYDTFTKLSVHCAVLVGKST